MRAKSYEIAELRDSREILLSEPHHFIAAFTGILFAVLICATVWMYFGVIDVYVKASGVVRPVDAVSVIRSISGGKVDEVFLEDGALVKQGDVLFTFDKESVLLQMENDKQLEQEALDDLECLRQYRECIDLSENKMDESTAKGRQYSLLVEKYLMDKQIAEQQRTEELQNIEHQKESAQLSLSSAKDSLRYSKSELAHLNAYKKAVEDDASQAPSESVMGKYAAQLTKYQAQLGDLKDELVNAEEQALKSKQLFEAGASAKTDVDDAAARVASIKASIGSLKQSELLSIEQSVSSVERTIEELEFTIKKAENDVLTFSGDKKSGELIIDKVRLDTLAQIDAEIKSKEKTVKDLQAEMKTLEVQMNDYAITAPTEGVVNLGYQLMKGELLQAGTEIGSIIPADTDVFKVTLSVSNKDIAGVKVGQRIKFKFLALPYQEYGMVDGVVTQIASDASTSQSGEKYYSVEASLENKPIKSYKGVDEQIKVGMVVEGQVISDTKRILRWALEKLDFEIF
ncbi:MAG: HlyD family secretion protein [Clostridiales bacterium]|jgi:HlyD family secretion protein|nr:HlyD family secretion protein [Clostridiales bacterium]